MRQQLADLVMGYDTAGRGRPLLLLHGYPLSRRLWRPQLEMLADTARLVAPDLRGHGETEAYAAPYAVDDMAADCAALLDSLGLTGPVVVGGLSMGGYVALAFYRQFRERVAGLILAATRAGADSADGKASRDQAAARAQAEGADAIVESMLPKMLAPATYENRPEVVAEARAIMAGTPVDGIVAALMAMKNRPDSTALLAEITCPVLIVHGLADQLIPPAEAEAMHAAVPQSRLQLFPDAGHLPNLEQPFSFNAEVRTFVQGL